MRLFFLFLITIYNSIGFAQFDNIGSGRSLKFDGIDDFIDLGNIYDDLSLPITISAWVKIDPSVNTWAPIFTSQDNTSIYNGFWFVIQPSAMSIGYGDGQGEFLPLFRRSKTTTFLNISNRWVHVAAVIRSSLDMDLYINGINAGGSYSGTSQLPMSSDPFDVAKIGYWYSNQEVFLFKGLIDEIRIWNRSLSQDEIRSTMCKKLIGNEFGLVGYWTFNEIEGEILNDFSTNLFHGQLMNGPERLYSGAPIGDNSVYEYKSNWNSTTVSISDAKDKLDVSRIQGFATGIQLYSVKSLPSQTSGLTINNVTKPYFGAFVIGDISSKVDINYLFDGKQACTIFTRSDNSMPQWTEAIDLIDRTSPIEVIRENVIVDFNLQLGPDLILCDQASHTINSNVDPSGKTFVWNTGSNSPSITIQSSSMYILQVTDGCNYAIDTIQVIFSNKPPPIYLSDNRVVCFIENMVLRPYDDVGNSDIHYTWQDGSTEPIFNVNGPGEYWVVAENSCGYSSDTVRITEFIFREEMIPNVITPNNDEFNQFFQIDSFLKGSQLLVYNRWGNQVYKSLNYQNDWDAQNLSSGIYFYRIMGSCIGEIRGTISVIQ
jgi:gliding motility-associated-like protein